jgi:hypothetical protein
MNLEGDMKRPGRGDLLPAVQRRREAPRGILQLPDAVQSQELSRRPTIEHVGIIVSAEGTLWKTADAGQPGGQILVNGVPKNIQAAKYCDRKFDTATGLLVGEFDGKGGRPMRRLCGWVDVDKFPFLKYAS